MLLQLMKVGFNDNRFQQRDTPKIRGYIAGKFPQYAELHHHIEKDKLLYKYPRIQYKVLNGVPMVIGIDTGVKVLQNIYDKIDEIQTGDGTYPIFEKQILIKNEQFGVTSEMLNYQFLTPWLALNEKNYERYRTLDRKGQIQLLNRILIGNILSMAKGLEYVVTSEIKVKTNLKPTTIPAKIKGVGMTGFLGEFQVNFNLPDYIGLGKSVSRGFGTIKKVGS